ncbi:MAG: hypothetical protein E7586_05700 [Ruminococcaceae bacterium]|nr:hypothetical protein [Oscillospiraceae bacterium]
MFRPKEFVGVIKYSNVTVENVKKYASHQPGATYDTTEVRMMYFVVSDEKRTVRKTIEYDWHWGDFYEGQTVAVLRFIDRPFLIIEPEKQNNVNS